MLQIHVMAPQFILLFGLTILMFHDPSHYPPIALIFFSFVILVSVLVSMELATVFAVLVSLIELFASVAARGVDRVWLAGHALFLWLALYGIHRFAVRDARDERAWAGALRESRRDLALARREKVSLEHRLDDLDGQTILRQHLCRAIQRLAGVKEPIGVRQRLMELARSAIPRGTVHFFTGSAPRDTMDQWVMEKQCPLLVTDVERDSRFKTQHPGSEVRSVLAAPVLSGDKLAGLIRLHGFEPERFSMADLRVLESLSVQASLALETLELRERLQEKAVYDPVTGLYSGPIFKERLAEEILRGGRYRTGFCLLLMAVDHMERYRGTYGHEACDQIAVRVAQALQACRREVDFSACYGEGAFALILPLAAPAVAHAMAQALREKIAAERFWFGPEAAMQERVDLHSGVAAFPEEATTASQLLRLAEERLLRFHE